MGSVIGSFSLPTPHRTSQLTNDARFSSIREYILDSSTLSGLTKLDITDLASNSIIYRIDLVVQSAFTDKSGNQLNLEIACDNGGTLMSASWNDPNTVGSYSTNCYTAIRTPADVVHVMHNLGEILTGSAILRFYIYNTEDTYNAMLTSDGLYYNTRDNVGILVKG